MKFKILLGISLIVTSFFVTGCTQSETAALVTTLGNAAASIAAIEGNSALAAKLQADVAIAATDVANWKQGNATQDVVQALNLVEADLSLFPETDQYAALIDLSIATVDSILEIVDPSAVTSSAKNVRHVAMLEVPKNSKQFKKAWNLDASLIGHPEVQLH